MKCLRSALFALGFLLAVSATQAQELRVKADIPFDFVVGNKVLPAGEYMVLPSGVQQAIMIRSSDSNDAVLSVTRTCDTARPADQTKLVFHNVAGRYFLYEIWAQGYDQGRQLPKSKMELQLAKNDSTEEFVLAANLIH